MNKQSGRLFIISDPSGCGKTTLVKMLLKDSKGLKRSISATTRPLRAGETNNKDYIFISREDFLKKIKQNYFLEWAKVFGQYYGTPAGPIRAWTRKGFDVILSIDVQGEGKIRNKLRDAVSVFIQPPSLNELKKRLQGRKTDKKQEIVKRLNIAKKEIACAREYDYQVINDNLKDALTKLKSIIIAERCKTG